MQRSTEQRVKTLGLLARLRGREPAVLLPDCYGYSVVLREWFTAGWESADDFPRPVTPQPTVPTIRTAPGDFPA